MASERNLLETRTPELRILDRVRGVKPRRGDCYTFDVRRLIVNADDLGMTAGVNRAIRECHAEGVVTSATLMANGPAFQDAVGVAQSALTLSVGCHVVLVDGAPILPPASIPSLLAPARDQSGRFPDSISAVATRAVLHRLDPDQLVREIVAQVQKIQGAGLTVTHLDTHKHAHIFPQVLAALAKAARICGVRAIRNPFVPLIAMHVRQFRNRPILWKRYGQVRVLRRFAARFQERMKQADLVTPDGIVGVIETGEIDGSLLREALSRLPEGTWELVCHPGYDDADLRSVNTRLLESREYERQVLTSASFGQFLSDEGIQLISYADLAGEPR